MHDNDHRDEGMRQQYVLKPYDPKDSSPSPYIRYPDYEPEEEVHLRDYLSVVLKRKRLVLTFFISVVVATAVLTFMATPLYKSTVVIEIDKESPHVLSFKEVQAGSDVDSNSNVTQCEIIKSRRVAEKVVKKLRLDKDAHFIPAEGELSKIKNELMNSVKNVTLSISSFVNPQDTIKEAWNVKDRVQENVPVYLVNFLTSNLEVKPVKDSQLVRVSFLSHRPDLAMNVTNAVAEAYIDYDLESRVDASKEAKDFLEKQIASMKEKMANSEKALDEYASKKEIIFIDQDKESILNQKLAQFSTALNTMTTERMQKEALYREIKESGTDNPVILNNSLVQGLKQQHASLEAEYSNLSKTYTPDFPKMKNLKSQIDSLQDRIDREKSHLIKSLKSDYEAALKKEVALKTTFEDQKKRVLDFQEEAAQYQILKRDVDSNKETYNSLVQRLNEVSVVAMSKATNIQIVDRATFPGAPDKPNTMLNILISIIFGLTGGIGLAFLVEYFDNTVSDSQEIEKRMHVPSMGMIPLQEEFASSKRPQLMLAADSGSPMAEVFRSISTFILFSSPSKPPKTMLITSPGEKEGKSTIAINIARSLAESLGNGILIDGDLRKPRLHSSFELDNKIGLSNYLSGNIEFDHSNGRLVKQTPVEGLSIITSGPIPPNPSALLSSSRMKDLLDALYMLFKFVIIDAPPVMDLSDSIFLSTIVDGTIIVVRAGETPKDALIATKKVFSNVNSNLLGVVLNGVKKSDLKYGYYSHYFSSYLKE
jgi:succinoglycan biosynthesis transport protein ExoP